MTFLLVEDEFQLLKFKAKIEEISLLKFTYEIGKIKLSVLDLNIEIMEGKHATSVHVKKHC